MKIVRLMIGLCIGLLMTGNLMVQADNASPKKGGMKMRATHEQYRAELKAMDERLDKLVLDMNAAAAPDKKLEAVAALLNELVAQQKQIHERMELMEREKVLDDAKKGR